MSSIGQSLRAVAIFIGLVFAFIIAVIWYLPYHSGKVAREFCNAIKINEDLGAVVNRAKSSHVNHTWSNEADNNYMVESSGAPDHQFWVYGMFGDMSMCKVVVTNARISSKKIVDMSD